MRHDFVFVVVCCSFCWSGLNYWSGESAWKLPWPRKFADIQHFISHYVIASSLPPTHFLRSVDGMVELPTRVLSAFSLYCRDEFTPLAPFSRWNVLLLWSSHLMAACNWCVARSGAGLYWVHKMRMLGKYGNFRFDIDWEFTLNAVLFSSFSTFKIYLSSKLVIDPGLWYISTNNRLWSWWSWWLN